MLHNFQNSENLSQKKREREREIEKVSMNVKTQTHDNLQ